MNVALRHDPGGRVRLALQDGVTGSADFSECGKYRRALYRSWDGLFDEHRSRFALLIGQNPSVADGHFNDPTVHREIDFTKRMGLNALVKCNVMDYRATKPKDLRAPGIKPCSEANLVAIICHAAKAEKIICAWGVIHKSLQNHVDDVVGLLRASGKPIYCFGKTKSGQPRHPLYLRADTPLQPFFD